MSRRISRLTAWLVGVALLGGPPAAFAMPAPQDPAPAPAAAAVSVDLRSPDARDAGRAPVATAAPATTYVVAAPDATDAARGIRIGAQVVAAPAPVSSSPSSTGFEWGDAAIGAAALLGLLALAGGLGVILVHHRRTAAARSIAS